MRIALLGDIALIGKYDLSVNSNAKENLKEVADYLQSFDYVIGNLESPLTDRKKSLVCKSMHLKSPIINIELLKYLHINAVSLANNHTYDYGRAAVEDTIAVLKKNKIDYFGIDNKGILLNNISINGFCCYSTNAVGYKRKKTKKGINTLVYQDVIEQVEKDKLEGNLSLLAMHWGDEHTNYPKLDHIYFSEILAKKNNLIINGHHPHVIQGIEVHKNALIAYSQGNFCFDDCKSISSSGIELIQNDDNRESFILEVEIEKNEIIDSKITSIREVDNHLILDLPNEKLKKISLEIKTIDDEERYENKRKSQFSNESFREAKFGRKNVNWYLKRLNYFAIGAFLIAKINKKKYFNNFSKKVNDQ